MELELTISDNVAEWLEKKAHAAGTSEAAYAAKLLESLAQEELAHSGGTIDDRLRFFREWVATLPPLPGPPVDARRDSIYD